MKAQVFRLGQVESGEALRVDLLKLVDTRLLIQGNSGGGKSWLLRLIAERAADKVQTILLDPEGEFATLREKLDIALVSKEGELAADVRAAGLLARKLIEHRVSAVVDLYDLALPDRRKFVRLFLEALMSVPRAQWHPALILLDECHTFAPERSAGEAESTAAVIALMSQGRKRGFAGILATQRLSKLHKDAAAEANNVIIGRTWLDTDQQRAGDLLGMNKDARQVLRDLAPGEFFGFGPALSANGVVRFRSDLVATTHPRAGERHLLQVPQASSAIREIVQQIGDLPAQAAEETKTLEAAQRRVVELERELRARPVQVQPRVEKVVEVVEKPVLNGELPKLQGLIGELGKTIQPLTSTLQEVDGMLANVIKAIDRVALAKSAPAPRASLAVSAVKPIPVRPAPTRNPVMILEGDNAITAPQQRILDALAQFEALGLTVVDKSNAAVFADQSPSSSGFTNNLGRLRTLGLIEYPAPARVALTESGRAQAKPATEIRSLDDLHRAWYWKLSAPKARILQVLIGEYPNPVEKGDLADRAGQSATSSGYTNNLGNLRSLGLVDYPRPGYAVATGLLFPEGLKK